MDTLTPQQERFCQEYVIDLNGTQAAIRASYSEKTAQEQSSRLLSNVIIQAYVKKLQDEIAKRNEITADWVVNNLREVAERCMQISPVYNRKGQQVMCENREGDLVPAFTFNALGASKSLELIGKTIGIFEDVVRHKGKIELTNTEDDAKVLERFMTAQRSSASTSRDTIQ